MQANERLMTVSPETRQLAHDLRDQTHIPIKYIVQAALIEYAAKHGLNTAIYK